MVRPLLRSTSGPASTAPALPPRRRSLAAALTLLLGACAPRTTARSPDSLPEPRREAPPPHLQSPAEGSSPPADGPARPPGPDPAPSAEVGLEAFLAYADAHSPLLSVARSTRSRAEASRVAASLLLPTNPELSLAAGPRFGLAGTALDLDLSLVQQVQIAGERGARVAAAEALRDLTDAEIEQLRWGVHCDVHAAFHRALVEQERQRLAERVVTFQQEVLRIVERQIAAGEAAPLALRLAQAEVAQAEQVAVSARQAFVASRLRLAQLSGWPVRTPPLPGGSVDHPHDLPPLEHLNAVAREHLPRLRTGSARVREAEARVALADREAWPRPSLGVQYRREGNPTAEGSYHAVLGVLAVPLSTFQRNQGERAQARADVSIATAELEAARTLLQGQTAEAYSEVVAATARTRAYGAEILPRFEENLTLLRRSFELGEIDLLGLSTGRERFLRIQSDALNAQQDYFVALAGLERVVGVDLWRDDHHEATAP